VFKLFSCAIARPIPFAIAVAALVLPGEASPQTSSATTTLKSGSLVCGMREGIEAAKPNMSLDTLTDLGCYRINRDIRVNNARTFAGGTLVYGETPLSGTQPFLPRWARASSVSGSTASLPRGD
jgi:hypothetical protein